MTYEEFILSKLKVKQKNGFKIERNEINLKAFEFQKDIVQWAVKKGKCAIFADCGLGKTIMQGEWARLVHEHTKGNILILAPLGVTRQTKEECKNILDIDIQICRTMEDVKDGINITNYENIDKFDTTKFIGVILDESSILKNFVGKTKVKLAKAFKDTKYKLSLTATPAPNDYLELLNQADFLDIMEAGKALATWFINDMKTGEWRLKGHAVQGFWEWVSSWAVLIDKPSDLGYPDDGFVLPKHNEITKIIEVDMIDTDMENNSFIRNIELSATSYYKEKRRTAQERAEVTAEIVNNTREQFIVWCDTNEEADLLKKMIPDAKEVRGSDKQQYKEDTAYQFKSGEIRVLISKPKIFGYGMNFQNCNNAVFCGRNFSFEDYYQGYKRLLRFGQRKEVNTWTVIGSTELKILEIVKEKQDKQLQMKENISNCIKGIQLSNFTGKKIERAKKNMEIEIPEWIRSEEKYAVYNEERSAV